MMMEFDGRNFKPRAFFVTQFYVTNISVLDQFMLVCDVSKSVYFFHCDPAAQSMLLLGQDVDRLHVYGSDFLVDDSRLGMVVADMQGNVQLFRYLPQRPESYFGKRLLPRADFHVGARTSTFQRLHMRTPPERIPDLDYQQLVHAQKARFEQRVREWKQRKQWAQNWEADVQHFERTLQDARRQRAEQEAAWERERRERERDRERARERRGNGRYDDRMFDMPPLPPFTLSRPPPGKRPPPPGKQPTPKQPPSRYRPGKKRTWSLGTTVAGSLICLGGVEEQTYKRLYSLHTQMTFNVQHTAGLNPKAFRTYKATSDAHMQAQRNIVDLDLLLLYPHLDLYQQRKLARSIGLSPQQVIAHLQELQRAVAML